MDTRHRSSGSGHGFTIVELICILLVLLFLVMLLIPSLSKTKRIGARVVCGSNLKGLGTAMAVYAQDHGGAYPQLPGQGPWSQELGFAYDLPMPDFSPGGAQDLAGRTVTASWYLLVREADVSAKAFVCPETGQRAFVPLGGRVDMAELWDFGPDPYAHVSYALHRPYGRFAARNDRPGGFAVAADMSPWFKEGIIQPPGPDGSPPQLIEPYWYGGSSSLSYYPRARAGNSLNHARRGGPGIGQNVLYADGHASFEKTPDVGIEQDNIYTFRARWDARKAADDGAGATAADRRRSTTANGAERVYESPEDARRIGVNPTARDSENDAQDRHDSFLVI